MKELRINPEEITGKTIDEITAQVVELGRRSTPLFFDESKMTIKEIQELYFRYFGDAYYWSGLCQQFVVKGEQFDTYREIFHVMIYISYMESGNYDTLYNVVVEKHKQSIQS